MFIKKLFYFLFVKTYSIDFTQIHIAKSKFQIYMIFKNLFST